MIYSGINRKNWIKYGKNPKYNGWLQGDCIRNVSFETSYTCYGHPKTIYSARYAAVSGFIFAIVDGKYSILANLRGSGVPDYQGYWNVPCGFLERFESGKEGIAREIYEECGFQIDLDDLKMIEVETEPEECNNGNVTIRYKAFLGKIKPHYVDKEGGEENEVDDVRWIPIDEVDKYKWAFNHRKIIKNLRPKKLKQKIIELYYKYIKNFNKTY